MRNSLTLTVDKNSGVIYYTLFDGANTSVGSQYVNRALERSTRNFNQYKENTPYQIIVTKELL